MIVEQGTLSDSILIAHEELSKAIEPRVTALHDPPSGGLPTAFRAGLFADLPHMRSVAALPHDGLGWLASIDFVGAQVLGFRRVGLGRRTTIASSVMSVSDGHGYWGDLKGVDPIAVSDGNGILSSPPVRRSRAWTSGYRPTALQTKL